MSYIPDPIDTADVELPASIIPLSEAIARNVHEVWARTRISQGWKKGPRRDDSLKEHPCLVPYDDLTEDEKEFDRNTAMETLKLITKLGFKITPPQQ